MISLEDCIALCGLTAQEVRALAEHEHIADIHAAALAQCLLGQPEGCRKIGAMIADDVNWAILRGDRGHADELCPALPPTARKIHWPLTDPAKATGSEAEIMAAFRATRDEVERRVRKLLAEFPEQGSVLRERK